MRSEGRIIIAAIASATAAGVAAAQPMSAQAFVQAAAQSDAYEIASGQLVLTESAEPNVRRFAQQVVEDHQKTSADLRAAAQASNLPPPPPGLSGDQQRLLGALQSQKGADLDRSFMTQQVNAHTAAQVTEEAYLATGTDPNLRKAAERALPLIKGHLEMARPINASMAGN